MKQHLVLTAVGTDRPGICNQVVKLVTQAGCNIVDSRIAIFGNEFTLIMLLTGSTSNITRVETQMPLLGQETRPDHDNEAYCCSRVTRQQLHHGSVYRVRRPSGAH